MKNRVILSSDIVDKVKRLCVKSGTILRPDVVKALENAYKREKQFSGQKDMLGIILENARIARRKKMAICQDTGMVSVFISIGNDVRIKGDGDIRKLVDRGVREAYGNTCFRKSIVSDPLIRKNTGTNTPSVVHIDICKGTKIKISVIAKGFGSENKSRLIMLNPTDDEEKIVGFCVDTVKIAGPDACPPYVLGVGIGGSFEEVTLYAKKALLRSISRKNPRKHLAGLEGEIYRRSNELNIGVMGLGGKISVLGVNIETGPTHIAGLPLAVNLSCWALRSASAVI